MDNLAAGDVDPPHRHRVGDPDLSGLAGQTEGLDLVRRGKQSSETNRLLASRGRSLLSTDQERVSRRFAWSTVLHSKFL